MAPASLDQLKQQCEQTPEDLEARLQLIRVLRSERAWKGLHDETWKALDDFPTEKEIVKEYIDTHSQAAVFTVGNQGRNDEVYIVGDKGKDLIEEIPIERVKDLCHWDDGKYFVHLHKSVPFITRDNLLIIREPANTVNNYRRKNVLVECLLENKPAYNIILEEFKEEKFNDVYQYVDCKNIVSAKNKDVIQIRAVQKICSPGASAGPRKIRDMVYWEKDGHYSELEVGKWDSHWSYNKTRVSKMFNYKGGIAVEMNTYAINQDEKGRYRHDKLVKSEWKDLKGNILDTSHVECAYDLLHKSAGIPIRENKENLWLGKHRLVHPFFRGKERKDKRVYDIKGKLINENGWEENNALFEGKVISSSPLSQDLYEKLREKYC